MAEYTWSAGRRVPVNNGGAGMLGSAYAGANNDGTVWQAGQRVPYNPNTTSTWSAGQRVTQQAGNAGNAGNAANFFNPALNGNVMGAANGLAMQGNQSRSNANPYGSDTWNATTMPQPQQSQQNYYTQQTPWIPYQSQQSYSSPSLLDRGNAYAMGMGMGNMQMAMQAPQNIANQINSGFDQQQFYVDRAADRDLKAGIVNKLLSGLGNMNFSGSGGGMKGFVDMNSGQAASLPGQTTNAITAQALSPQAIAGAAQQARSTGPVAPPTSQRMTGAQAGEVNQIASDAARSAGGANANAIDRGLTAQNAQLQRGIELAKSKQGIGNANWLTNLNSDNANNAVASQAPIIRLLMNALGGGLQGAMNQLS